MKKELSAQYLSEFCMELALLQRSGMSMMDGLTILREDDDDKKSRALLDKLSESMESGMSFSAALSESGCFPDYMINMILLGEQTGKLDDTLSALSAYYARQTKINAAIKSAVMYPVILLALMAAVVIVLITQVLPIFNDVFNQMGMQMSSFANAMMRFGTGLSSASTVLVLCIAAIIVIVLTVYLIRPARAAVSKFFANRFGGSGIFGRIASARFASAMAMAMTSGLDTEQAIDLAGKVAANSKPMTAKVEQCKELFSDGEKLEKTLSASGILSARESRMLTLASRAGAMDEVMEHIAEQGEEKVEENLNSILAKIEPILVILISVVVGAILLSVVLPLMGIMSSLG